MPNAYPLAWPAGWPRTRIRPRARFSSKRETAWGGRQGDVSVAVAMDRLQREMDRISASSMVLSSNLQLRVDGLPRGGQTEPVDPGVCLYFRLKGKDYCMPCDRWDRAADNIAALAKHIEAMRGMERWGVGDLARHFAGYQALPAPDLSDTPRAPEWAQALGFQTADLPLATYEERYRQLARKHHPDISEDPSGDMMAALNAAISEARRACT